MHAPRHRGAILLQQRYAVYPLHQRNRPLMRFHPIRNSGLVLIQQYQSDQAQHYTYALVGRKTLLVK